MATTTTYLQGLRLDDHTLRVPLVHHDAADTRTIEVFARVVTPTGGENLPFLVYLQGGPGFEAPRVALNPLSPGWLGAALKRYRVVMLDQRGTGRSTPVDSGLLSQGNTHEVAEYLSHFRADSIVEDAELLREHLGASTQQWNLLGQSFGGFTAVSYISTHPESVHRAFFTGGLPPVTGHVDEFYSATFNKMRWLSENYYSRFPHDRERMRNAVELAAAGEIVLPDGEVVSPSRLRSIGMDLGRNDGWLAIHNLLEWDPRSATFAHDLSAQLPFDARNPIYFLLHEACGANGVVTNWSAERVMPADFHEDSTLLTGEHVFGDWCETVPAWQPWAEVARELAQWRWTPLFDPDVLQTSGVRGAATIYLRDAFVPFELSMTTADLMPGVREIVTNSHEHNGLRAMGDDIFEHMCDVAEGIRYR
ncbi:alpha/beta fold hydrolase [Arcanobacterium phocisimile]|uniref:Alpha/beta fold hydrolase n=1 Tax=Arcanobacterium phocisimile TaxID=1302235 RepID=A0ABX7IFS1_9ACTO|nr:alpha/beta fold hydrolase [Arcanobacterium phocisimile]QRV01897.1 alpha/beta fold hydrolase [Arcanobacterium phocisimile]